MARANPSHSASAYPPRRRRRKPKQRTEPPVQMAANQMDGAENLLKAKKSVIGVPLDQWIEWNKNNLRLQEVPMPADSGMRLFVQCMEIKKGGPQTVAPSECNRFTAKLPTQAGVY